MAELVYNADLGRFEAISDFTEKDIFSHAGFSWDGVAGRWHTQRTEDAAKVKQFASPQVAAMVAGGLRRLIYSDVRTRYEAYFPYKDGKLLGQAGFTREKSMGVGGRAIPKRPKNSSRQRRSMHGTV
jgi:hypothetical protein